MIIIDQRCLPALGRKLLSFAQEAHHRLLQEVRETQEEQYGDDKDDDTHVYDTKEVADARRMLIERHVMKE